MPINLLADDIPSQKPINLLSDDTSLLEKAGNVAGKFNSVVEGARLPAIAGGALQGIGDMGTSLANIPLGAMSKAIGKDLTLSHPHLRQYLPQDTATSIGFGAGNIGSQVAALPAASERIGAMGLEQLLSKLGGLGKAIAPSAKGSAAGGVLGENEEGKGRDESAIAGGIVNPALSLAKFMKGLVPENLARGIVKAKNAAQLKYSNAYQNLFDTVNKLGLNNLKVNVPQADFDLIKSNSPRAFRPAIDRFLNDPTLENAHWAQSDLGKFINKLDKADERSPLSSEQYRALDEAEKAQELLRTGMSNHLKIQGQDELAQGYEATTQGYANDVVPYRRSRAINDFQKKRINAKTFAKRIAKDDEFRLAMEKKHPEIGARDMLQSVANNRITKWGTAGLVGGLGAKLGYNSLFDNSGGN